MALSVEGAASFHPFLSDAEAQAFREKLRVELSVWSELVGNEERFFWPATQRLGELFDALRSLHGARELPAFERRLVRRVLKYLVSPLDLLPEYIYGVEGYQEDVVLIALAVKRWEKTLGRELLARHGLDWDDADLAVVRKAGRDALDEDVMRHLELLLEADYVSGDGVDRAVECTDPAGARHTMVFAGPGTGKTYRIEQEVLTLLVEKNVSPEQIIVTTFTNKAADELRVRVRDRLIQSGRFPHPDAVAQRLSISTIHALCHFIIATFHHHLLFLKGTFSPIDPTQRTLFLFRRGIGELRLKPIYDGWKRERKAKPGYHPTDLFHFYSYVGQVYDFLSEEVVGGTNETLRTRYLQLLHGSPESVNGRLVKAYPRYWKALQGAGYLDHSMVLAYVEALLDDPHVAAKLRERFRYVLVDEYQDTNPIQDRIFRKIVGETGVLFAVADDDQSIYAFRGADVRNATAFAERYPGATIEHLEHHRRSTKELLAATQSLIGHNTARHPKELVTDQPAGEPPWILEADLDSLPVAVAELIADLKQSGTIDRFGELALLFRGMTKRVAAYKDALDARNIPVDTLGKRRFLKEELVHGLVGVLKMIQDDPAKITTRKRVHRPFFEALGWSDRASMLDAVRNWNERLRAGDYQSILDLFYDILDETGAIAHPELLSSLGRFSEILGTAEQELRSPDLVKRLGFFLQYLEAAAGGLAGPEPLGEDGVQILTIHKSKGMEWPVVIVADATADVIPARFPPDTFTRLREELGGGGPSVDHLEEERRVLYVGLTRAERLAVLATTPESPSPFLAELPSRPAPKPARCSAPRHRGPRRERPALLHASHSQLFNYHQCPKRYLLENVYGFAGRATSPLRAGKSLHRALEILHRLRKDGEPVPADRRRRILERAWLAPSSKREAKKEFAGLLAVLDRYGSSLENAPELRVVDVERPFYVAETDGVLTGTIDLVRQRGETLEIVEFKFHKNPLQEYPQQQLDHYRLAFPDEEPALVVHYLKEGEEMRLRATPAERTRAGLIDTFGRIRAGEFDPHPSRGRCGICPVRSACAERAT